jgi:mRNA turnover protein 4
MSDVFKQENVQEFFNSHSEPDFARTGAVAEETVSLHEGPLSQFGHAMEPQLRGLGMPTALKKGVIHLIKDFVVCSKGDKLTSEQARILKLLGHQVRDLFFLCLRHVVKLPIYIFIECSS